MKAFFQRVRRLIASFLDNNCSMHAAGLTYFALLAIVPVLCCVLVVAKTCNVDRYAREQINAKIDLMIQNVEKGPDGVGVAMLPMFDSEEQRKRRIAAEEFGKTARSISNALFARVESFDVGTLGWVGFGFLLWTIISSLASVETSFNDIFAVPKARPIWKRALLYLFILVILPVLSTVAMSLPLLNVVQKVITATLGANTMTRWMGEGLLFLIDSALVRFVFSVSMAALAFGFFFWVMPNCRVNVRSAGIGGLVTALAFGGWLKVCAIAQVGIAKSSALYGSFAFLPIVLAWLYMSWQIVLFGACLVGDLEKERSRIK